MDMMHYCRDSQYYVTWLLVKSKMINMRLLKHNHKRSLNTRFSNFVAMDEIPTAAGRERPEKDIDVFCDGQRSFRT